MGGFVWVTHFERLSVPFYQATGEDPTTALAADLLFGIGETVGAGERHSTEEEIRQALLLHQVDHEPYDWYLRMKALRPQRTAGFGLGTERYLCWLLQHDDIRDCQLIPRFNRRRNLP
jgi:asparaginyl-tRNA synthetase